MWIIIKHNSPFWKDPTPKVGWAKEYTGTRFPKSGGLCILIIHNSHPSKTNSYHSETIASLIFREKQKHFVKELTGLLLQIKGQQAGCF